MSVILLVSGPDHSWNGGEGLWEEAALRDRVAKGGFGPSHYAISGEWVTSGQSHGAGFGYVAQCDPRHYSGGDPREPDIALFGPFATMDDPALPEWAYVRQWIALTSAAEPLMDLLAAVDRAD